MSFSSNPVGFIVLVLRGDPEKDWVNRDYYKIVKSAGREIGVRKMIWPTDELEGPVLPGSVIDEDSAMVGDEVAERFRFW